MDPDERAVFEKQIEQKIRQQLTTEFGNQVDQLVTQRLAQMNISADDSKVAIESMTVNPVSAKIIDFWTSDPETWLVLAEAQFHIARITSEETKYNTLLTKLPQEFLSQVKSLITKPYRAGHYDELKKKILEKYKPTQAKLIEQVLDKEEMGDRKPSEFLRHLSSLADSVSIPESIVRDRWLRRLPSFVRAIISVAEKDENGQLKSLEYLATIADEVYQKSLDFNVSLKTESNRIETSRVESSSNNRRFDGQRRGNHQRQRSKSRGPRSPSPWRRQPKWNHLGPYCYNHWKFGKDARSCNKEGCKWSPNFSKNGHQRQ